MTPLQLVRPEIRPERRLFLAGARLSQEDISLLTDIAERLLDSQSHAQYVKALDADRNREGA